MTRSNALFGLILLVFIANITVSLFLFQQIRNLKSEISPATEPITDEYREVIPTMAIQPSSVPTIQTYPTIALTKPSIAPSDKPSNNYPAHIIPMLLYPIQQICTDNSAYKVYYQLDDGTNIYTDSTGNYVRGKTVVCTNSQ